MGSSDTPPQPHPIYNAPSQERVLYMRVGYGSGCHLLPPTSPEIQILDSPPNVAHYRCPFPEICFHFWSAYFGAFSGPFECLHLLCTSSPDLWHACPVWHSRLTVKRALNVIFPGGEYMTNLIAGNVETLHRDDCYSHSFSSGGHEFGGHDPVAPLGLNA